MQLYFPPVHATKPALVKVNQLLTFLQKSTLLGVLIYVSQAVFNGLFADPYITIVSCSGVELAEVTIKGNRETNLPISTGFWRNFSRYFFKGLLQGRIYFTGASVIQNEFSMTVNFIYDILDLLVPLPGPQYGVNILWWVHERILPSLCRLPKYENQTLGSQKLGKRKLVNITWPAYQEYCFWQCQDGSQHAGLSPHTRNMTWVVFLHISVTECVKPVVLYTVIMGGGRH